MFRRLYCDENLSDGIKDLPKYSLNSQTLNDPKTIPSVFKFLPKWQNLAESGHMVCSLV